MSERDDLMNLYKLRGDAALAALESLLRTVEAVRASVEVIYDMERKHDLKRDMNLDGMGELLATLRRAQPHLADKSDTELLAMFGGKQGGAT